MRKVSIVWLPRMEASAKSIYGGSLEFCMASPDLNQCYDFCTCKEYVLDCACASLKGEKSNYAQVPTGFDKTRVLIARVGNKDFMKQMETTQDFLNSFERILHLKRTEIFEVENLPLPRYQCGIAMIEGSKMWIHSPTMLSLYSLLIRSSPGHVIGQDPRITLQNIREGKVSTFSSGTDRRYLTTAKNSIEAMLKIGYRKMFYKDPKRNYPESTYSVHNGDGIVCFSQGLNKDRCKKWSAE